MSRTVFLFLISLYVGRSVCAFPGQIFQLFARSFQTAYRDTTNDLNETFNSRETRFCWVYLKSLSDQDAALCQDDSRLHTVVGTSGKAATRVADRSKPLYLLDLLRLAKKYGPSFHALRLAIQLATIPPRSGLPKWVEIPLRLPGAKNCVWVLKDNGTVNR